MEQPRDFFISYNQADRVWAEWIAWQLENASYTVIIEAWDFRPGNNLVSLMHTAAIIATRTIAVLSPDYLQDASYSEAQWSAAFAQDPTGKNARLLPVRVRECEPQGLFKAIISINLIHLDEQDAHEVLLAGINGKRAKTSTPSPFPDIPVKPMAPTPSFPGKWPLLWTIPATRNPYFTGRETILQSLRDQLVKGNTTALTQAISGLGGIGKTQTAIEYAYRNQQQYRYILWIGAATHESLLADLSLMADLLEVPGRDAQNQQNTAIAVKNYLAQQSDWLLIFDNADDIEMVRPYFPRGNKTNGHILLTTRTHAVGTLARAVQVDVMDKDEGIHLLLKRGKILKTGHLPAQVGASDRTVAASIVEAVGGLPLALDQAAAYIEETGCSLSDYLKIYETRHWDLLQRRGELVSDLTDHPEAVATTWSLSFQKVAQKNKAAAELLRLCAFLAPDAIPEEVISGGASKLGKILAPVAADPLQFNEALGVLRKYSLIKRDPETNTLTIHRLVQQVLKAQMNEKVQRQWAECAVRAVSQVFPYGWDVENWPQCRRLLAQAQRCEELIKQYGLVFADAARLLVYGGYYLYQQALYEVAESFLQGALRIVEKLDDSEYPRTFDVQHELARLYQAQGKYEEAEGLYREIFQTKLRVLGSEHSDTAATQHELARVYKAQGKYEEAGGLYREVLQMKLCFLGSKHPSTAMTQHNLAYFYEEQGKYEDAEALYKRALQTYEQKLGLAHPHTKIFVKNYTRLLRKMKRTAEADALEARVKT
jgi:tetratricopeptide (TPR) repeat protein